MSGRTYTELTFAHPDPDEYAWQLVDLGAAGAQVLEEAVLAYFSGDADERGAFVEQASALGFVFRGEKPVEEKNWHAGNEELFRPVRLNRLKVCPLADSLQEPPPADQSSIFLVPGEGFGTGHHPTTRQALLLLQHPSLQQVVRSVCDFGCGSGILSVAAWKLFHGDVVAIDISEDALGNARDTVRLNRAEAAVTLRLGSTEHLPQETDLLVANIYAEVLCELEPKLRATAPRLVIAGILEERLPDLEKCFEPQWRFRSSARSEGWCAFLLERLRGVSRTPGRRAAGRGTPAA